MMFQTRDDVVDLLFPRPTSLVRCVGSFTELAPRARGADKSWSSPGATSERVVRPDRGPSAQTSRGRAMTTRLRDRGRARLPRSRRGESALRLQPRRSAPPDAPRARRSRRGRVARGQCARLSARASARPRAMGGLRQRCTRPPPGQPRRESRTRRRRRLRRNRRRRHHFPGTDAETISRNASNTAGSRRRAFGRGRRAVDIHEDERDGALRKVVRRRALPMEAS